MPLLEALLSVAALWLLLLAGCWLDRTEQE